MFEVGAKARRPSWWIGDAEFILLDALYKLSAPGRNHDADDVHVISAGAISFKRYLELAKLLGIKVAVRGSVSSAISSAGLKDRSHSTVLVATMRPPDLCSALS